MLALALDLVKKCKEYIRTASSKDEGTCGQRAKRVNHRGGAMQSKKRIVISSRCVRKRMTCGRKGLVSNAQANQGKQNASGDVAIEATNMWKTAHQANQTIALTGRKVKG